MWMGLYICPVCNELYTDEMLNCDLCPDCGEEVKEFTEDLYHLQVAKYEREVI